MLRASAGRPLFLHRLRVSTRPSLQNSAYSGRHGGSLPFSFWGRGRQAMHLPCKQAYVGALPTGSTISLRETRPAHRGEPHKLVQVGATPTPATSFLREVIRLPDCKSGVINKAGSDEWSITTASHHFGLVAQSAERPVVCGRVEGASPFGSANLRWNQCVQGRRFRLLQKQAPGASHWPGQQRVV